MEAQPVKWTPVLRPGYFGRNRDKIVKGYNDHYGVNNWELRWRSRGNPEGMTFVMACYWYYQQSYLKWFREHPEELDYVCSFGECIDNALTNIDSGCDYSIQEAYSTHIQDIAVRSVLRMNRRWFTGASDHIIVIRAASEYGGRYSPGRIPFFEPALIEQPELKPSWANSESVESFWQSNKWLYVRS